MDYKKMMTVAGALICASAMAGVESSVVGYQNKAASESGLNWMVNTFLPVNTSEEDVTIADIAVSESWDPTQDNIQILNGNGGTAGLYTYISAEIAADNEIEGGAGWYDADKVGEGEFVKTDDVSIPYGKGMAVSCAEPTTQVIFSGEVKKGSVALEMTSGGLNWSGNALPADITIADLTVGADWDPTQDNIQFLNGNGGTSGLYTYISAEVAADNEIESGAGWYDADKVGEGEFELITNLEIPAGKAFAVTVATDGTTVILPAAINQ